MKNYTKKYKLSLFEKHKDLIEIIYWIGNGLMLRRQLREIANCIYKHKNIVVDFALKELMDAGLLKQKNVLITDITVVYLTKMPLSVLENKTSRNVTAINPTEEKILNSIFRTEYVITRILNKLECSSVEEFINTLNPIVNTILLNKNDSLKVYEKINNRKGLKPFLTNCFKDDYTIAKVKYIKNLNRISKEQIVISKKDLEKEELRAKIKSNITESLVNYFDFSNMMYRGFGTHKIVYKNGEILIKMYGLDINNSNDINNIYKTIAYSYLMFIRMFGENTPIKLDVEFLTWNKARARELNEKKDERVREYGTREISRYSRSVLSLKNAKLNEDLIRNINVSIVSLDIDKYGFTK